MNAQRTLNWYRDRLGYFTGSKVGLLMQSSNKKGEIFGQTAKSYIYKVAAERNMNPKIVNDDYAFEVYLNHVGFSSKAIEWGIEQEENARDAYIKKTKNNIVEVGSCRHKTIKYFASSPDGFCCDDDNDKGCIEIKCPNQETYIKYVTEINDAESLLKIEPIYYYQCMSHLMCTKSNWVDFTPYCPFQKKPIHIVRILPNKESFNLIEERVNLANEFIEKINLKLK